MAGIDDNFEAVDESFGDCGHFVTTEETETWCKSSTNYVTFWHSDPTTRMAPTELHSYLTQLGFTWETDSCSNWTMYTIWEPNVLKKLEFLREMHPGLDTNPMSPDEFWNILESGFKTFELKIDSIAEPSSNYVVARIDGDGSPYFLSSNNDAVQAMNVSEFIVGGRTETHGGFATLRCTPLTLVAGGSLSDILKATLRRNDILIGIGSVKRLNTHHSQRVTLLNFDGEDNDFVFIRVSFLPPSDADVTLLESITPTTIPNDFIFDYRIRQGKVFHKLERVGHYTWNTFPFRAHLLENIPVPLQYDADVGDVYHRVLEHKDRKHSHIVLPHIVPVPSTLPPITRPPISRPEKVSWDDPPDRDMPVFFANDHENDSSAAAVIPVQIRRHSASDIYIPTLHDIWTSVCFLLIVFMSCFFVVWMTHALLPSEEGSNLFNNPSGSSGDICLLEQHQEPDHPLTRLSDQTNLSRLYEAQESFITVILEKIVQIYLWMRENLGIDIVMNWFKLSENETNYPNRNLYYGMPIV